MSGRIRSIKPEWLEDEAILRCSSDARVVSIALLLLADDHGNGRGSDLYLGSQIFPGEPLAKIRVALGELSRARYVGIYEVDGQTYFAIRSWGKHQKVDRPGKPRVPRPLEDFRDTLAKIPVTLGVPSRLIPIPIPIPTSYPDPDPDHLVPGGALSLTAPSAPVSKRKRKRDSVSPERQAKAGAIKSKYCTEYLAKYGKLPPWGAREWGQLYDLLGSWDPGDVLRLVPLFFAWRNQRAIQAGHQWGKGPDCFVLKVGELDADVQAPERRKTAAIAHDRQKQDDHAATTDDQAARVAAMVRAKHANGQDPRTVRETNNPARSLLPANQRPSTGALDREALSLHRPGAGSGDRRGDDAAIDPDAWRPDPDHDGGCSEE